MPTLIDNALFLCLALASALAVLDHIRRRSWQRSLIYALAIGVIALGLLLRPEKQSFGGASPLLALILMFVGVLLGIAATYIFNFTGAFSWRDLARPLVASPLVLLPLIGSLQGANLEPIQLICFTVLAFQNGFFWQQVLRDAKPSK
jgi:peptidoglycan/LPS O-acetylase OafA/YrhL